MLHSNGSPLSPRTQIKLRTVSRSSLDISYAAVDLTAELKQATLSTVGGGAFSDLYKYMDDADPPHYFAIKQSRYRLYALDAERATKRIKKEIRAWSSLVHDNILQLEGVLYRPEDDYPCLVSRWMDNGSANRYCATGPNVNLMKFVSGIADGLLYMHQNRIAHGDIRGDNILVSECGQALICDFGLSKNVVDLTAGKMVTSVAGDCAVRYRAPEFHTPGGPERPTPSGDVFMFGQTLLELWSGRIPYPDKRDPEVIMMLSRGELPNIRDITAERIEFIALKERVHSVCSLCWIMDPTMRPSFETIAALIHIFAEEQVPANPLAANEYDGVNHAKTENNYTSDAEDLINNISLHNDRTNRLLVIDEGYATASDHQSPSPIRTYDIGGASSSRHSLASEEREGYIPSPTEQYTPSPSTSSSLNKAAEFVPPARQTMTAFLTSIAVNDPGELTIIPDEPDSNRSSSRIDELSSEQKPIPLFDVPPPPSPTIEAMLDDRSISPKSTLYMYFNRLNLPPINSVRFEFPDLIGPLFTSSCKVGEIEYGRSSALKKKDAEVNAASLAIRRLYDENPEGVADVLSYCPRFEIHLIKHNLSHRIKWDDELENAGLWICRFIVDDTIFAQGEGADRRKAKEDAARKAATLWIDITK